MGNGLPAPTDAMKTVSQTGYVISDLHLFAQRSVADQYLEQIREAASRADFFVLNGDIIDFRWSVLPSIEATVEAGMAWLEDLTARCPDCRFIYILGNHDCLDLFHQTLVDLAERIDNLDWHETHVQIGSALFFHGDLAFEDATEDMVTRELFSEVVQQGKLRTHAYRLLIATRLHRGVQLLHGKRITPRRIFKSIDASPLHDGTPIQDVYFGHTHVPFTDFEYRGVRFHNTGSAIRGMRFNMLRVDVEVPVQEVGEGGE